MRLKPAAAGQWIMLKTVPTAPARTRETALKSSAAMCLIPSTHIRRSILPRLFMPAKFTVRETSSHCALPSLTPPQASKSYGLV